LNFLYVRRAACNELLQIGEHFTERERPSEHESGRDPVVESEWVAEVGDGQKEGDKLAECNDECDGQGGTLGGEYKHRLNANISEDEESRRTINT